MIKVRTRDTAMRFNLWCFFYGPIVLVQFPPAILLDQETPAKMHLRGIQISILKRAEFGVLIIKTQAEISNPPRSKCSFGCSRIRFWGGLPSPEPWPTEIESRRPQPIFSSLHTWKFFMAQIGRSKTHKFIFPRSKSRSNAIQFSYSCNIAVFLQFS